MDGFLRLDFSSFFCRKFKAILAIGWTVGLLFGAHTALSEQTFLSDLAAAGIGYDVAFPGLAAALILPLLFSILAISVAQKWLLIPISFGKAFLFSYSWMSFSAVFGASGWLLRILFMFSDAFLLPLLWWFWLHIDAPKNQGFYLSLLYPSALFFLVICFDYAIIVPFCAQLI